MHVDIGQSENSQHTLVTQDITVGETIPVLGRVWSLDKLCKLITFVKTFLVGSG